MQDSKCKSISTAFQRIALGLFFSVLVGVSSAEAQPTIDSILGKPDPDLNLVPPARETYMGRTIAQTMHYRGAGWLIRSERELEERCSIMLSQMGLKEGMTVCDLGCGNGFYSLPMAKMVGNDGQVLAVDVQPEMLELLRDRAAQYGLTNVSPILGSFHDPHLPPDSVDAALLVDVYHEFSHPEEMLQALRRSLKEDGVAVLLEYRMEDPEVPIKRLHKMSREQIMKEWPANGFKLVKEYEGLPWQHMMFFGRDPDWSPTKN